MATSAGSVGTIATFAHVCNSTSLVPHQLRKVTHAMTMKGGCLCGGVQYEIAGEVTQPIACHCSQCGRTSGNFAAMLSCKSQDIRLVAEETLAWYQSSESVR